MPNIPSYLGFSSEISKTLKQVSNIEKGYIFFPRLSYVRYEVGLIFWERQNRFRGQVYFCVSTGPALDPKLVIVEGTNQLYKFDL